VALLGAIVIMTFALVNGYALFFNDSRTYIRGPALALNAATGIDLMSNWRSRVNDINRETSKPSTDNKENVAQNSGAKSEHAYVANRSIYYGTIPFLGYIFGGFWLAIFLQSYCVAFPLAVLFLRCCQLSAALYLGTLFLLTWFTPLGAFASLMMPDIFAPVMIICVAVAFTSWSELKPHEKMVITALTGFSTLAHASHIVILALLVGMALVRMAVERRTRKNLAALVMAIACMFIGVAGELAFDKGLERVTGERPLVLPHIMAHLIEMGPGYQYIKENCSSVQFEICRYEDRLPQYWEDFLGADPKNGVFASADMRTKRLLSNEQMSFAIAVLKYDPIGVVLGSAKDVFRQFGWFSLKDVEITPAAIDNYRGAWPKDVSEHIEGSRAARQPSFLTFISEAGYVSAVLSVVVLGALLIGRLRGDRQDSEGEQVWSIGFFLFWGVVANAVVCGAVASPYDRFQARVVWLLPLFAIIACASYFRNRGRLNGGRKVIYSGNSAGAM
jgi:hypothetical protein